MAINKLRYSQEFERQKKKGKGFAEADAAAIKFATTKAKPKVTKAKPKVAKPGESLVTKTARRLKEVFYGGKTYAGKKYGPAKKLEKKIEPNKKKFETTRTKAVTSRLKTAGLTDKEIARLKGKK